jgi:hypothetical protein
VPTTLALVWGAVLVSAGCRPGLDPAPVEVDDPLLHFFQHFEDDQTEELERALWTYADFLDECEETALDEGNSRPECDLETGLSTTMLQDADLTPLVEEGRLADYPTEEQWEQAVAIVVARRMPVSADTVEGVMLLPNQSDVFPHFERYERTYLTSLDDYEAEVVDLLRTENDVRTEYILSAWGEYILLLDFRSIHWDDGESDRRAVIIRSWLYDDAVVGIDGASVGFTFSIEVNIPCTDDHGEVWRTQGAWSHADLPGTGDDHDFWENQLRDGTIDGFDQLQDWIDAHP